jgi:uncharacterized protein YlxW (UPF0749 family)
MTELSDERPDIGRILIMLGGLEKASNMIIQTLSEDRTAAATYRTEIRTEMAKLSGENQSVRSELNTVKAKVEKIEPIVDRLERKEHGDQAVKTFASSIASFLGKLVQLGIGAAGGGLALLVDKLLHK